MIRLEMLIRILKCKMVIRHGVLPFAKRACDIPMVVNDQFGTHAITYDAVIYKSIYGAFGTVLEAVTPVALAFKLTA